SDPAAHGSSGPALWPAHARASTKGNSSRTQLRPPGRLDPGLSRAVLDDGDGTHLTRRGPAAPAGHPLIIIIIASRLGPAARIAAASSGEPPATAPIERGGSRPSGGLTTGPNPVGPDRNRSDRRPI